MFRSLIGLPGNVVGEFCNNVPAGLTVHAYGVGPRVCVFHLGIFIRDIQMSAGNLNAGSDRVNCITDRLAFQRCSLGLENFSLLTNSGSQRQPRERYELCANME